jgi:hypothetical protein
MSGQLLLSMWFRKASRRIRPGTSQINTGWMRSLAVVDHLERRLMLSSVAQSSAAAGIVNTPPFVLLGKVASGQENVPDVSSPYAPSDLRQAYGVTQISLDGVAGDGSGQTIAIVDAYNDPNIITDANTFSSHYGLPQFNGSSGPTLQVLNELGQSSPLPANASAGGWDVEESLDVEWAHSMAPNANIILVEANSNSSSDLYPAAHMASGLAGVSVVSMSFGGSESQTEQTFDADFTTPAGHQGVTFLASTGDSGAPGGYPAFSPNVVAVGGTDLSINSNGSYGSETGWSSGGGGVSTYESQPSYQTDEVNGVSTTNRSIPDVSINAGVGVSVLDTYYSSSYLDVGGTSLACPMWAGLVAIADQGRVLQGEGTLDGRSQTLPDIYSFSTSDNFHDITSGNNGFSAGVGYDLVTGIGSPVANLLVPTLVNNSVPVITTNPSNLTVTVGQNATFTAAASGNPTPAVQWMVETSGSSSFSAIVGASSTTLNLGPATLAENGNKYEAVFSNGLTNHPPTTTAATLTVNAASAGSLTGSQATAASSYNLTTLGAADWAHWGRGGTYGNFDHKASGNSQISNVTQLGTGGNYGGYTDSSRNATWTDGTPTASDTNEHGYIWANAALGAGYSFTVPADTTTRTLYVYAGGFSSGGTLTAHLSDGSAADYVVSASGNGIYSDLYTITYTAASAGQTLKISYVKSTNINGTGGSVDLIGAWLTGQTAGTAPAVTTNPTNLTVTAGATATFTAAASGNPTPTVQWMVEASGGTSFSAISGATSTTLNLGAATVAESGNKYEAVFSNGVGTPATTTAATLTVNAATTAPTITANPVNLTVTVSQTATFTASATGNPTPTVQWMVETSGGTSFSAISGATSTTLNLGAATLAESGNKYEAIFSNGVGAPATTTAATLTVNAASTGSLAGSQATAASSYNLTTLGTADWAHWGRGGTYANFDHKASGASQISNVTQLGTGGNYGGYSDSSRDVIWSDGTPTSTDSGDDGYIWANTALGAGYSFTVPADTTTRTLYVYAGGYSSGGTLTAHLSDGSAADYVVSASGNGIYSNLYTITYTAASAGQTLKISYVKSTNINGTGGSVDLIGAWLTGTVAGTAPSVTTNPTNLTVTAGATATFTAAASGNPTPTVQWMVETSGGTSFSAISGATSTTLNLGAATVAESGNKYEAVFSNGVGTPATTTVATLTVNAATTAPVVTTNPTNLTVTAGATATFTAAASGNPTPTVQWMVETSGGTTFSAISGATSTTLNLGAATVAESGNKCEAVFSNGVGTPATTTAATLTVNAASTGSLTGSQATAASSYNLTTLGTADWAHWGRGGTYANFDHKATGASQISNVTQLGTGGNYGGYSDPTRNATWSDGTPTASDTNEHGYIWANTALGAGYSFTVPADTTTRTLYVYAGGISSGGTLTAHLSDGSAADYVVTASGTGLYTNLYTITYTAASAGQTLKISYVKSTNINGTGGSVDLIAAALT